jgi:S-(hydroxymethyl)glutathione dehydrogenase / alcohol dehydrogenase
MRAAVLEGIDDLQVADDVEIDKPHEGEVLVRIQHCGVCHSDLHFVDGSLPCAYPSILGHEAGGIVEAIGAGVLGLHEGDKVILTLRPPCGRCYFCVRGQFSICSEYGASAMTGTLPDGGTRLSHRGRTVGRAGVFLAAFAEQAVVPANGVVKVPDDTPLDIASVIGCAVQTGVGAVLNTAKVDAGATVMIVGLGGIGISIAQGARIAGASQIIGVDPVASRRQGAATFGVTETIDPTAGDVAAQVLELTGGIGIDYAFDAVGQSAIVDTCVMAIRPGGTVVMVGVPKIDQFVNLHALMFAMSEKKLTGCFLGSSNPHREFPRLLSLWRAGLLDLDSMVTARRPLDEIVDAFADMKAGTGLRTVLSL